MPNATLKFLRAESIEQRSASQPFAIIGQLQNLKKVPWDDLKHHLEKAVGAGKVGKDVWSRVINSLNPSPTDTFSIGPLTASSVGAFSDKCSRHNMPSGAYHIPKLLRSCLHGKGDERIVVVCQESEMFASGCAIARSYSLFSMKTDSQHNFKSESKPNRTVYVEFVIVGEKTCNINDIASCLEDTAASIQMAARIVDAPCNYMNTSAFVQEAITVGQELGIIPTIIQGEELNQRGFGGIYGVGKASDHPPALVVLSHKPAGATKNIAWCGKGIVYDTGGLSIKGKTTMPGMKRDCGGAAAILSAFKAAVKRGFKENLHCVLCLAENSVGPTATRPDDIHILYSGKTVEINNTDAEGRLVLGDGVAYASKDLKADIILDMATLTGAQGVSTGKHHAAIMTNRSDWENATVHAGRMSGDLTFPMVYCPELHFSEFNSAVADMKNSVADRGNAQSSCAGLFIGSHLKGSFNYPGSWIHVDMASPAHCGERATGYGVALLLVLFGQISQDKLLQSLAPQVSVLNGNVPFSDEPVPSKRHRHA